MKNSILNILGLAFIIICLFNSCKDDGEFDNKVYLTTPQLETIINKANTLTDSRTIQIGMAKPESHPINVTVTVNPSLLREYSTIYKEEVELLSSEHYTIPKTSFSISTGAVLSEAINIVFEDVNQLDREKIYVLPIAVSSSELEIVQSKKNIFYVIKGGALINVVANVNENFLGIPSFKTSSALTEINDFTIEGLIYPRELNKLISSVIGVEGYFLLRIGDAGVPPNRLQIAASSGGGNRVIQKDIPLNKWTHFAVVYNKTERVLKVYYDGEEVYTANSVNYNTLSFARTDFLIGKSWDDNRSFNGEFSEFRIWKVARSQEEIAATPYEVPVNSPGLVAYWKMNEGSGSSVKDHTVNGNDMTASKALKWVSVELPEKVK